RDETPHCVGFDLIKQPAALALQNFSNPFLAARHARGFRQGFEQGEVHVGWLYDSGRKKQTLWHGVSPMRTVVCCEDRLHGRDAHATSSISDSSPMASRFSKPWPFWSPHRPPGCGGDWCPRRRGCYRQQTARLAR